MKDHTSDSFWFRNCNPKSLLMFIFKALTMFCTLLCVFIGTATLAQQVSSLRQQLGQTLQSSQFNLTLPIGLPANATLSVSANLTNSSVQWLGNAPQVECNGDQYKRDLRELSCLDAIQQIPDDPSNWAFSKQRFPMTLDIGLPQRFISCEW